MSVEELNPDSAILGQVRDHWEKIAALVIWKLAREKGVAITYLDMEQFNKESDAGEAVLLTWAHRDSIELKIVTREAALRIAAHDQTQRGTS
jgi:hypothetical protein